MLTVSKNYDILQQVGWNYFGNRHGKNENDGVSAVVKSHLVKSIMSP